MKVPRSRRRGKSRIFRVNTFNAIADARIIKGNSPMNFKVEDIIHDSYRTAPLMKVRFEDGTVSYLPAFNGAYVGQILTFLKGGEKAGSIDSLKNIPTGANVYNIELRPNDGGKLVRSSGLTAKVIKKEKGFVSIQLPSSKIIDVNENCRAVVGVISNSGRMNKPLYKAGNNYHLNRARGRYWPLNAAVAMNAYEHKFGGKRRSSQHKSKSVSRNASPGAKVGTIAPRRTGVK
ncbi:MAG: 50S ribosomal protein L2 [Candidatus Acidifodinimicrobium sp.]